MSNGEYFEENGLHGHILFKVCEASGRPPPSYRFIKHDGKTRVEVTVGDEGPVQAGPYEHSWQSKGEVIDAWLMKYLPNWFKLKVWEAIDYKSQTPTLHSYCRSGQLDKVKVALKRGEDVNRVWQHGPVEVITANWTLSMPVTSKPLHSKVQCLHLITPK